MTEDNLNRKLLVTPGCFVALLDQDGNLLKARIVEEAKPSSRTGDFEPLSRYSALGISVMNHRAGDIVTVVAPAGSYTVEILGIGAACLGAISAAWRTECDGDLREAAQLLEACANPESAARRYGLADAPEDEARCYRTAGSWQQAAELYELTGNWMAAGECRRTNGDWQAAAAAFERANAHDAAGQMFDQAQNWEQAAMQYRLAGDLSNVGRCLEHLGDFSRAAVAFREAGEHFRAATCLEGAGDSIAAEAEARVAKLMAAAARNHEACKEWEAAADGYSKSGHYLDAAKCFELAGLLEPAAEAFTLADCQDDWLRCKATLLQIEGDYSNAAGLFEQAAGCAWWDAARLELLAHAAKCRRLAAGPPAEEHAN